MYDLIKRDNEIWEWHNVLEDPSGIVEKVLPKDWRHYTNVGGGESIIGRSTVIQPQEELYGIILDAFSRCLNEYTCKEPSVDVDNMGVGWWLFREYAPGSEMYPHGDVYSYVLDSGQQVKPKYTALLYLNDNYLGGEIAFPDQDLSIKPKPGSMIIFPSHLVHEVKLITEGYRYMTQTYIYDKKFSNYEPAFLMDDKQGRK